MECITLCGMKFLLVLILLLPFQAYAEGKLPLPRFVAMKSNEANVRSGPGLNYPIDWVMKRRSMPVEIIAEYEQWRRIRDIQGDEGWVHVSMLSGTRTVLLQGRDQLLRTAKDQSSKPLARVEVGAIGELLECSSTWCRVEFAEFRGWLNREQLWGLYPDERFE